MLKHKHKIKGKTQAAHLNAAVFRKSPLLDPTLQQSFHARRHLSLREKLTVLLTRGGGVHLEVLSSAKISRQDTEHTQDLEPLLLGVCVIWIESCLGKRAVLCGGACEGSQLQFSVCPFKGSQVESTGKKGLLFRLRPWRSATCPDQIIFTRRAKSPIQQHRT